jgi:AraC-like DNA-binding protein
LYDTVFVLQNEFSAAQVQIAQKTPMPSPIIRGDWSVKEVESYQALTASAWETSHEQLSPGSFDARLHFAATPTTVVYHERFGAACRIQGALRPGLVGVAVPGPATRERGRWWGGEYPTGAIPYGSGACEIDMVFSSGYDNMVALLEEEQFRHQFEILAGHAPDFLDQEGNFVAVRPGGMELMSRQFHSLINEEDSGILSPGTSELEKRVVEVVVDALASPVRIWLSRSQNRGLVYRALVLASASDYSLSVTDLCLQLRSSKRTLEYAFGDCLGMPPSTFFRLRRLNLCRALLSASDPAVTTVKGIIGGFGFRDSGRFAANYRSHFGEFPSDTLRRPARAFAPAFQLRF